MCSNTAQKTKKTSRPSASVRSRPSVRVRPRWDCIREAAVFGGGLGGGRSPPRQYSTVWGEKKRETPKTLNGRLPLEDSSDFDDFWTESIAMT